MEETLNPPPIVCHTAAEFLDKLDPSSDLWGSFEYGRWIYRGQNDAAWDLTPKTLRPGQRLSFRDPSLCAPLAQRERQEAEWLLLAEFIDYADELGFTLPGKLTEFRFPWAHLPGPVSLDANWPDVEILDVVAIAQHHGVPTRLLDFTLNPLVAAYFAAKDSPPTARSLAVWAVDTSFLHGAWPYYHDGVRVVQVSRGANPFLHAQSGLFLYDQEESGVSLSERILNHDIDLAPHIGATDKEALGRSPRIIRLTMPSAERSTLLERLAARRITRGHLQPTLDNVVSELWKRAPVP